MEAGTGARVVRCVVPAVLETAFYPEGDRNQREEPGGDSDMPAPPDGSRVCSHSSSFRSAFFLRHFAPYRLVGRRVHHDC